MFPSPLTAASLLLAAPGALAGINGLVAEGWLRGSPPEALVDKRLVEDIEVMVVRRQAPASTTVSAVGAVATMTTDGLNMTAWNDDVNTKCEQRLAMLSTASNPSGTCVCYNLPILNNSTGAFEADLRLYQVSAPTGEFSGVSQANINVTLSYNGASVSAANTQQAEKSANSIVGFSKRQAMTMSGNQIRLLQTYLFIGQIDKTKLSSPMDMAITEALVTPVVTLTAPLPNGQIVSTNVSSNEAAFIAGAFSGQQVLSSTALASLAVQEQLSGLKNGTVAFVLPGVQILIVPVGLIITGTWLLIGMGVIAMGWIDRVRYAQSFRRRKTFANKQQQKTF